LVGLATASMADNG